MEISNKLTGWELEKALFLTSIAYKIGMDLDNAICDVNNNSGNVYLYSEFYNFTLYMPINCDLIKSDVIALYNDFDNTEEVETDLSDINHVNELDLYFGNLYNNN
jgi:hypothetical protein